jgi:peptidyl-prolyl cis-trans isomerase D
MATLEKIRSKAVLLVVAIGLALFAFIIGDLLKSGSTFFNQSKQKIATVDGETIGIKDFQDKLEERTNNYKNRNNGQSLTEAEMAQIRQSVFDEMVSSILLEKESEKIGFTVSKEELADLIMGNNISPIIRQIPDFQNPQTGNFDKNVLLQFLQTIESDDLSQYSPDMQQQIQNYKTWWLGIEEAVIKQKLLSKFATIVSSAMAVNSLDAKAAYDENSVSVDFNYVSQNYNTMPDADVEVTDAEISKLYAQRKNSFKQEGAKVIDYIALNIVPSQEDFAEAADRMGKIKTDMEDASQVVDIVNENSDIPFIDAYTSLAQLNEDQKNFIANASIGSIDGPVLTGNIYHLYKLLDVKQAPDSVKAYNLNLPEFGDDARSTAFADSLINIVKSGKTFAEMAQSATNGQANGDIGWQTESSLVQAVDVKFKDALFGAKLNEVFVVKSALGSHLVQVVEKTKPVSKYKIASIQMAVTASPETYNKLYSDLNQYVAKNHNLNAFKSEAEKAGYSCQTDVSVLENQSGLSLGMNYIENSRQVIKWAYNNKKGALSDIFECQDYFVVAGVEGTLKEGVRSFKDVSDILKRELINEKKGAKIVAGLKAKNLTSLEAYGAAMNSTPQEVKFVTFSTPRISGGIGVEPLVNAKALAAEVGQLTEPFAGTNAVYVLSLTDKKSNGQSFNVTAQKQQLDMQNSYLLMSVIQNSYLLKENVKIEDNRIRYY